MGDKKIEGALPVPGENKLELKKIKTEEIKKRLNFLKKHLAEANNYRDRWTDFDVAVICWLLAHDPDELEFWKETEF
jgi:hypothetical protein